MHRLLAHLSQPEWLNYVKPTTIGPARVVCLVKQQWQMEYANAHLRLIVLQLVTVVTFFQGTSQIEINLDPLVWKVLLSQILIVFLTEWGLRQLNATPVDPDMSWLETSVTVQETVIPSILHLLCARLAKQDFTSIGLTPLQALLMAITH